MPSTVAAMSWEGEDRRQRDRRREAAPTIRCRLCEARIHLDPNLIFRTDDGWQVTCATCHGSFRVRAEDQTS